MYVKPFICVVGKYYLLLQYLLKFTLPLSSWRLQCYYNQRNSVGIDRENVVPGNLCIIWKLNEAWSPFRPLKKHLVTFSWLLKFLILTKDTITVSKLLTPKKDSITFLGPLKFLTLKKDSITSLSFLKVLILKNDSITFLWLLKFFKIAIL